MKTESTRRTATAPSPRAIAIPNVIADRIAAVRRRRRLLEMCAAAAGAIAIALVVVAFAAGLDWRFAWNHPIARWLPLVAALGAVACVLAPRLARMRARTPVAREALEIDRAIPELEERWSTTSELSTSQCDPALLGSPALIAQVAAEARDFESRVRPRRVAPAIERLRRPALALAAGCGVFGLAAVALWSHFGTLLARFAQPWRPITLTRIELVPMPDRVMRHGPVEIAAEISGRVANSAMLRLRDPHGALRNIPLSVQRSGPRAAVRHRIAEVDEPFAFQLRAGDAATPWIAVEPADRPGIERLAMRIVPPAYTKRPPAQWDALPRDARALRGSTLELEVTADQPLARAVIEAHRNPSGEAPLLQPLSVDARNHRFTAALSEALHLSLILENAIGLRNLPAECRIEVEDDLPPTVRILETSDSVALTADDSLRIEFEAKDDFAVASAEVVAITQKRGEAPRETVLPVELGEQAGKEFVRASARVDLKPFKLDAETKLSYAVRVRDSREAAATAGERPEAAKASENSEQSGQPNRTPKRALDVGQTCTPPKPVRVEQFAPRRDFSSEEKKSIAIGGILAALRESAANAAASTEKALDGLSKSARLDSIREMHARDAFSKAEDMWKQSTQLKQESNGTPYAFIGIQIDTMMTSLLHPAAKALNDAPKAIPARPSLEDAAAKLRAIVATIDKLTQHLASVKDVKKAEELFQQLKEMHTVFVENMPEWLKAGGAKPYQRSMFEVDAAFAKAFEEMLRQRAAIRKQLAEILAKNPELAARFLDQSEVADKYYRDELLRLKGEQEGLRKLTDATGASERAQLAALWQARLRQARTRAAGDAARIATSAMTWLPRDATAGQRAAIESAAAEIARTAATPGSDKPDEYRAALDAIGRFESALAPLGGDYAIHRREDLNKLRTAISATRDFSRMVSTGKFADAIRTAQTQLNTETGTIAALVLQGVTALDQTSNEAADAAKEFKQCLADRVATPQQAAITAMKSKAYALASSGQERAATGLDRAVELLDEFAQAVVRKLDESKPARGTPPPAGSLEELLAALEEEKRQTLSLGIACRPPNIRVEDDWQRKSTSKDSPAQPQQQAKGKDQREQDAENSEGEAKAPQAAKTDEQREQEAADLREHERRLEAANENARAAARAAANAQRAANERAEQMSKRLETLNISPAASNQSKDVGNENVDWNTLPSELRASLLQERGRTPPKRYQRAIEEYFKTIARDPKSEW
jgi:hypothetical protein